MNIENLPKVLEFDSICKTFYAGTKKVNALNNISFSLYSGESAALVGPSGSGKSTLLGIAAGLEKADSGSVTLLGNELFKLSENKLAEIRSSSIGFIFQNFRLLGSLTAIENIEVPAKLLGLDSARENSRKLLELVGLKERETHYPSQLSGGEQQRVAIARAFSANPKILFADEPTGNLDYETALGIQDLLFNLQKEHGTTLLIATHDRELASRTKTTLSLKGGTLS